MKIETIKEKLYSELSCSNKEVITPKDIDVFSTKLYNTINWGAISSMELILTENCNLSCHYCFVRGKRKRKMSLDIAKTAINFLLFYSENVKDLNITIFGGEPLLETGSIYKILDYCSILEEKVPAKKFSFSVTTNGTLITEELLKNINGRFLLLLSIDGDEKTHNKFRVYKNDKGSFNNVFPKIRLLKKYQGWVGVRMTVHPEMVDSLSGNVEFLYNNGVNQFIIGTCYGPKWNKKALRRYEEELLKVSDFYSQEISNGAPIRITYFEKSENKNDCLNGIWGCRAGRNSVTVDQNGDIYPCSKFVGLESFECEEFRLGNIFEGITNFQMREKLFKMTNKDFIQCVHCAEIDSCVGGCPAENYNQNRSIYIPCKDQCEITRIQNRVLRKFWAEQEKATEKMAT